MKISVCIPVYNFDVRPLVNLLNKQISADNLNAEIILIDDASKPKFKEINLQLKNSVKEFIHLQKNIGRSKIRNLFLTYTSGSFLLFLDCDVLINQKFLINYFNTISKNPTFKIIYGGVEHDEIKNLRALYTEKRESQKNYKKTDAAQLKSSNFLIEKNTFIKFPFDESISTYGYEDYLFAKTLEHHKVSFLSINNAVIHSDNGTNETFLKKTEESLDTLLKLTKDPEKENLLVDVKVYKAAKKMKALGLSKPYSTMFKLFEKPITRKLVSNKPNLFLYDIYKLGKLMGKI